MRVLVIGGNGFIGSHVADILLQRGADVVVYDRHAERFRCPLPRVTYIRGDLCHLDLLENTLSGGIDSVIHLASTTSPQKSNNHSVADVEDLVDALGLLRLCVKYSIKKIVFASSGGTVYGIPQILPVPECHTTEPICSHGIVKLAIEKYIHSYNYLYNIPYIILRISNPYGVRQTPESGQGVIAAFVSRILRGEPVLIWGDGTVVRDFVSVRDLADLFFRALVSDAIGVFNAGSGIGVSINQLLQLICSQFGATPEIVRQTSRMVDVPTVILDCQKARKAFCWEPQITLPDGLIEVSDWLSSLGPGRALVTESVSRQKLD